MSHDKGWIGVDLDGSLAIYDGWRNDGSIGAPIPKMVNRVKQWLKEGKNVKIMTARVYKNGANEFPDQHKLQQGLIQEWCLKYIGQILPITAEKDFHMYELWDDRAVQLQPNTGTTMQEIIAEKDEVITILREALILEHRRAEDLEDELEPPGDF
jgi:hypothetical protein